MPSAKDHIPLDQIKKAGYAVRENWLQKNVNFVNACDTVSRNMLKKLDEMNYHAYIVSGSITKEGKEKKPRLRIEPHAWMALNPYPHRPLYENPVFIDLTLTQFSHRHAKQGLVSVNLGKQIPKVAIFTKDDEEYNWYQHPDLPGHTPELEIEAVKKHIKKDKPLEKVAEGYGITTPVLKRWIKEYSVRHV